MTLAWDNERSTFVYGPKIQNGGGLASHTRSGWIWFLANVQPGVSAMSPHERRHMLYNGNITRLEMDLHELFLFIESSLESGLYLSPTF